MTQWGQNTLYLLYRPKCIDRQRLNCCVTGYGGGALWLQIGSDSNARVENTAVQVTDCIMSYNSAGLIKLWLPRFSSQL